VAAHLLSNYYNTTRNEYYRQLNVAGKKGNVSDFLAYAILGFRDNLDGQLEFIFQQIIDVSWQHYIYEHFRPTRHSPVNKRRRDLALHISNQKEPLTKTAILITMSKEYKGKSEKTLSRDITALKELGFIREGDDGYTANKELALQWTAISK